MHQCSLDSVAELARNDEQLRFAPVDALLKIDCDNENQMRVRSSSCCLHC